MLPAFRRPVFYGTPTTPGTGWFDREGVERSLTGVYGICDGPRNLRGKPYTLIVLPCGRCGGAGGSDKWSHTGWTCFDCSGSGKKPKASLVRLYRPEELQVLNARRDALRAKKATQRQLAAEAEMERQTEIASQRALVLVSVPFYNDFKALMDAPGPKHEFLTKMWELIHQKDLSEKQQAAVEKWIASARDREYKQEHSSYLGQIGQRMEIVARVAKCKPIYPTINSLNQDIRYLVKFETPDRETLTWFTSRSFVEGTNLRGRADVVAHKEFNGVKETQIKNFRVKDEIDDSQKELF